MEHDVQPKNAGDKMLEAEEAALAEYLEGAPELEGEEDIPAEIPEEPIEEPVVEEEAEAETEDELEAEPVDEPVEAEPVEKPFDVEAWDGNPNTLPDDLRELSAPVHKVMERGMQMKFRELADERKAAEVARAEYMAKLEQLSAPAGQKAADAPPQLPDGENVSREEWERAFGQMAQYHARQEAEKLVSERIGQAVPNVDKLQDAVSQIEAQNRLALVAGQEGFNDDVAFMMRDMADKDAYWNEQFNDSDKGAIALFNVARKQVDALAAVKAAQESVAGAQEKAVTETKRKASAGKRAVSRGGETRKATSVESFAKIGFEEAERLAREEYERDGGG